MHSYPVGKPVNVLLVEDDDVDAKAVKRRFRKEKIANPVFRVKDGVEALETLRGENGKEKIPSPYIIIADLNMPRMSGIDFIEAVRADPTLHESIIFVLTTSRHEKDKSAAYKMNVAGYMVKDNVGEDFMQMVTMLDKYWKIVELP